MLSDGLKKYFADPVVGMIPFAIYIVLETYIVPVQYALIISLVITFTIEMLLRNDFITRIHRLSYHITAISFVVIGLLWFFGNNWIQDQKTYVIIGEIAIIVQLMIIRIGRSFLKERLFKQKGFFDKALLNDSFYTASILKYLLMIHVLGVLAYKQISEEYLNLFVDHILYVTLPLLIILGIVAYQMLRTKYLVKKLKQEEWLPIVTDKGEVKGRIARAVSRSMGNKYMHPVVRIALICDEKIYLQERDSAYVVDPGKIDHPFEKYMLFKHEVEETAKNSVKIVLGRELEEEPEFILNYVFENDLTKRLIFLFIAKVDSESDVIRTEKMTGKFWTVKQIDEEFGNQIFGECFELEYEYLKHMILLENADVLIATDPSIKES